MSKHWKPRRQTVELRPSRIRREPVRLEKKVEPASREREIWDGVAGVLLYAAALAVAAVGISVATYSRYDPEAAAQAARFGQCYNAAGSNCVLDGDTIYVGGDKVEIAGIEAPQIDAARCADERSRGIEAAMRLADLLNGGKVTVSAAFRDPYGRDVRTVQVKGQDVGEAMIDAGLAARAGTKKKSWCG